MGVVGVVLVSDSRGDGSSSSSSTGRSRGGRGCGGGSSRSSRKTTGRDEVRQLAHVPPRACGPSRLVKHGLRLVVRIEWGPDCV